MAQAQKIHDLTPTHAPIIHLSGDLERADLRIIIEGDPVKLAFLLGLAITANPDFRKIIDGAIASVGDCPEEYQSIVQEGFDCNE